MPWWWPFGSGEEEKEEVSVNTGATAPSIPVANTTATMVGGKKSKKSKKTKKSRKTRSKRRDSRRGRGGK